MNVMRVLKGAAVSMALVGILVPRSMLVAGPKDEAKAPAIVDVALDHNGTLSGEVLDPQGAVVDGAIVSVRQGKDEVANTVSGKDGKFSVPHLKGGVYEVSAGEGRAAYRLWAPKTAPPSAKDTIRIISEKTVVRGQFGCIDLITILTLTASIGAVVTSAIALSKIDDVEDKLDDAIAADDLPATP